MEFAYILLVLAVILLSAKLLAELSERASQPAVLGELLAGLILGDSLLRIVHPHNEILHALAELGAVLLLFEIGLESDITELFRVGWRSLWVAIIGVVTPAVLGFGSVFCSVNLSCQPFSSGQRLPPPAWGLPRGY